MQAYDERFVENNGVEPEALYNELHQVALSHGCAYHVADSVNGKIVTYSVRGFKIVVKGDQVSFSGEYDIRAFLKLYRTTNDETVQQLLFHAATPCCYCIDDKCTTLLMADKRTVEFNGRVKKLCGPYRHNLNISVNEHNLLACVAIVNMIFEYTYPYMHKDPAMTPNDITYRLTETNVFYLLGYKQKHSPISLSDEEFIASLLTKDETGKRRVDTLLEAAGLTQVTRYVGAVDNFNSGVSYDFIFGLLLEKKPDMVPAEAVCRKVGAGQWAVYNSSAGDYKSIWRHYTERFYSLEHKGYDCSRIPIEYYDQDGRFSDVHIPVDAEMPADSGFSVQVLHSPNVQLAGFRNYAETDYPLYKDRMFDDTDELNRLFPHAQCVTQVSIHSLFGKPLMGFNGVAVDDLSTIPDGVEFYTMQGGYWKRLSWKHFNGGYGAWGEALGAKSDSMLPVFDLHHPRGFNQYVYNARGGYAEIDIPMRLLGKRYFELVELAPQRVIGKLEAPPESIVTEADIQHYYQMLENTERGSYIISFTQKLIKTPESACAYYDQPLITGICVDADSAVPDSISEYTLDNGLYMRVTEDMPNGVLGWELGSIMDELQKQTGYQHDTTRRYIYKQRDYGKSYELYVPVIPA